MPETRARPARERQRFKEIARANMWFYRRLIEHDDPSWEMKRDWEQREDSLKIRRWRNAQPQETADCSE